MLGSYTLINAEKLGYSMNAVKAVASGLIGGLLGALVWSAIVYFAHAEIGWIAWGIGFLVGFCVRLASGEEFEGAVPGVVAVGLATLSIVVGKYLAAIMLLGGLSVGSAAPTFDDLKLVMANGGTTQYNTWDAVPAEKKAEIEQRWNDVPPEDRDGLLKLFEQGAQISATDVFLESFSPFDLLWFGLAALTAYRLGSGTGSESD